VSALPGCADDTRSVECVVDLMAAVVVSEVVVTVVGSGSPIHVTSFKQPFNTIDWRTVRDNIGAFVLDYGLQLKLEN